MKGIYFASFYIRVWDLTREIRENKNPAKISTYTVTDSLIHPLACMHTHYGQVQHLEYVLTLTLSRGQWEKSEKIQKNYLLKKEGRKDEGPGLEPGTYHMVGKRQ